MTRPRAQEHRSRTNGRACITCHGRKVRCDILEKGIPCTNCRNHDTHDCRLYEKKKTRASFARNSRRSTAPIQPRGSTQQPITAPATPAASSSTNAWTASPSAPVPRAHSAGVDSRPTDQQHGEDEPDTRNLAEFLDREDLRTSEIHRAGRLYFIGTEFSNLNYLVRQRSRRPDQNVLHYGSNPLAAKLPTIPPEALELPTKVLADELIEAYFTHVNRGFPVVDEDEFMKIYHGEDTRVPRRTMSLLLLNAVFCVGAHVLAGQRREMVPLKTVFFERTKSIYDCRFEQHRETYLQAALLLTWQCQGLEDIVSNSWYWVGVAARTAMGMGLHRDATSANVNAMDQRQWVRLWWIIFQFDTMVSTSHGRPQAINLDDTDVKDLQEWHFVGIPDCRTSFVMNHTQLCVIFSKTMRRRCSLRATATEKAEATKEADEALAQFITTLPESLQLSLPDMDVWQATLHLTYNNFLILLHRPSPRRDLASSGPDTTSDLSVCFDAAATITSIFDTLRAQGDLCKLWLPSIYVLFTAMVFISTQANSSSPLMAAKSKRLYNSLILSLQEMSSRWIYAKSLLRLFRGPSSTLPSSRHGDVSGPQTVVDAASSSGDDVAFSLRPNPMQFSGAASNNSGPSIVDPFQSGQQSAFAPGYVGQPGFANGQNPDVDLLDVSQTSHLYGEPFDNMGLSVDGNSMDMLPVPSALEFLLAGMGNDFEL